MARIVTLTFSPSLDLSADTPAVTPNRKLRCSEPVAEPGGGGINVARVATRLGAEVTAVYPAGGTSGARLQALLDDEGVASDPVAVATPTRENLTVTETHTGDQYRFVLPGAAGDDGELEACIDTALGSTPAPAYVVASGSLPAGAPVDLFAHVAERVAASGARLVLDTSGKALQRAVEAPVFLVKPNFHELEALVGPHDPDAPREELVAELVDRGVAEVVVHSIGPGGVIFAGLGHGPQHLAPPAVEVRSRVGAGDSMVAGMVTALAAGRELPDAVRYGLASGTAAVTTPGSELCDRDTTERLYRQISRS
jgi:6-phosphofructokinase 2